MMVYNGSALQWSIHCWYWQKMVPNQLAANENSWQRLIRVCKRSIQNGPGWVYPKSHPGLVNSSPSCSWNDQNRAPLYFVVSHVAIFRMIGIDTCPCKTLAMGQCNHGTCTVRYYGRKKYLIYRQKKFNLQRTTGLVGCLLLALIKLSVLEVSPTNDHGITFTSQLRVRYSDWLYKGKSTYLMAGRSAAQRGEELSPNPVECVSVRIINNDDMAGLGR